MVKSEGAQQTDFEDMHGFAPFVSGHRCANKQIYAAHYYSIGDFDDDADKIIQSTIQVK